MSEILKGYCHCGCGNKTDLATKNDNTKGWTKGEPLKFIRWHHTLVNAKRKTANAIGNKSISSHGYVVIRTGMHMREYEHILVAEKALGRKLVSFGIGHQLSEVVHHIDGNKQNNSNSNLLVCTHKYHTELHHRLEKSSDWPTFKKIIRNDKRLKNG